MRKLRVLVILGLIACWAPTPSHAQVNIQIGGGETWYQGHPGRWYQENNQWRWRDADDGNEYYQDRDQYNWRKPYKAYKKADRDNHDHDRSDAH
jgi:hypothetical protein